MHLRPRTSLSPLLHTQVHTPWRERLYATHLCVVLRHALSHLPPMSQLYEPRQRPLVLPVLHACSHAAGEYEPR